MIKIKNYESVLKGLYNVLRPYGSFELRIKNLEL